MGQSVRFMQHRPNAAASGSSNRSRPNFMEGTSISNSSKRRGLRKARLFVLALLAQYAKLALAHPSLHPSSVEIIVNERST
jgi:hypothetical protein